jgi:hypothetical protein
MLRLLLFMHHIAPCTIHLMHCIMSISAHVCAYAIDHVEPESKIQEEQSSGEYDGPQAISCADTNLDLDQGELQCI